MNPRLGDGSSEPVDRHGLEVLDPAECRRLIVEEHLGRIGFSSDALPVIFPVNYVSDGELIHFRSEAGQKLKAASSRSVACLEIDHFDRFGHTGWSVLATGRLDVVEDDEDHGRRLPVTPWALGDANQLIVLSIELLSGRRIRHHVRTVS